MIIAHPRRRVAARNLCGLAAVMSASMLAITVGTAVSGGGNPVAAAVTSGTISSLTPSSGNSATDFGVTLPAGAACPGDTASGGYRVQSYLVPASRAPESLTFDASGPIASGGGFHTALFALSGDPFVNGSTSVAASAGGPGLITGIPSFNFTVLLPNEVAAGDYNLGIACTLGQADADQLTNVWNTQITVAADANGGPAQFTYVVSTPNPTTSSTSSSSTSTTVDDTTSTTVEGSTTSTTAGGSTTTAVGGGGLFGGGPTGATPVSPSGVLPYTGGDTWTMVVWGALLLVFGRMAILLAKKPKVVDPSR